MCMLGRNVFGLPCNEHTVHLLAINVLDHARLGVLDPRFGRLARGNFQTTVLHDQDGTASTPGSGRHVYHATRVARHGHVLCTLTAAPQAAYYREDIVSTRCIADVTTVDKDRRGCIDRDVGDGDG